jgi:hypothetical protein
MSSSAIRTTLLALLAVAQAHCGSSQSASPEAAAKQAAPAGVDPHRDHAPKPPAPPQHADPAISEEHVEQDRGFRFGSYVQSHVAFNECDQPDMCEVQVSDVLTIAEGADGALDVAIEVTQDNGHSCSFSGILAELGQGHWGWSDETQTCQVDLRFTAGEFNLMSDGCRETYCGARAQLQGSFKLAGYTAALK